MHPGIHRHAYLVLWGCPFRERPFRERPRLDVPGLIFEQDFGKNSTILHVRLLAYSFSLDGGLYEKENSPHF